MRADSKRVGSALEAAFPGLEGAGPARWNFAVSNGQPTGFTARLADDWLHLDAPADDMSVSEMALAENRTLPGYAKLVLPPRGSGLRLRAELPVEEEIDLEARLEETRAGLFRALQFMHGEPKPDDRPVRHARIQDGDPEGWARDLEKLCAEAGRVVKTKAPGQVAVEGLPQPVLIEQLVGSACLVSTALPPVSGSPSARAALGLLLLSAGSLVRMARPAAEILEDRLARRFEVRFASPPAAAELDHAIEAVHQAGLYCRDEVQALEDESAARIYLALRAQIK